MFARRRLYITILATISLFFATLLPALTPSVSAVDVLKPTCENSNATSTPEVCKDNDTVGANPVVGPRGVLTTYVKILSFVVGILSVGMIIFGGIRYITSNGDSNTVAAAQKTVIYALVGLVVALIAQAMVIFVLSKVKG